MSYVTSSVGMNSSPMGNEFASTHSAPDGNGSLSGETSTGPGGGGRNSAIGANPGSNSRRTKTKYPKVFQCTGYGDCRMTFTRSEHLARHIRKHTGERPFKCHCNRTFSRLDNLRQHMQTVHADDPHNTSGTSITTAVASDDPSVGNSRSTFHMSEDRVSKTNGGPRFSTTVKTENEANDIPMEDVDESNDNHSNNTMDINNEDRSEHKRKHRPQPISIVPANEMMHDDQHIGNFSPSSPLQAGNSGTYAVLQQASHLSQHPQHGMSIVGNTPSGFTPGLYYNDGTAPYYSQAYPPAPQTLPTTPVTATAENPQHQGEMNPANNQQPWSGNHGGSTGGNGRYSSPTFLAQHRSTPSYSSIASSSPLSTVSNGTTFGTTFDTTRDSQYGAYGAKGLSVLGGGIGGSLIKVPEDDRPRTWGPTTRYSHADEDDFRNKPLPPLSSLFGTNTTTTVAPNTGFGAVSNTSSPVSTPSSGATPPTYAANLPLPPLLSNKRSYTKNLILPRPDSYPPPKSLAYSYDQNTSSSGSQQQTFKTLHEDPSEGNRRSQDWSSKPLPPLPPVNTHASTLQPPQQQQPQQQPTDSDNKGSIDILLRAAGV